MLVFIRLPCRYVQPLASTRLRVEGVTWQMILTGEVGYVVRQAVCAVGLEGDHV